VAVVRTTNDDEDALVEIEPSKARFVDEHTRRRSAAKQHHPAAVWTKTNARTCGGQAVYFSSADKEWKTKGSGRLSVLKDKTTGKLRCAVFAAVGGVALTRALCLGSFYMRRRRAR